MCTSVIRGGFFGVNYSLCSTGSRYTRQNIRNDFDVPSTAAATAVVVVQVVGICPETYNVRAFVNFEPFCGGELLNNVISTSVGMLSSCCKFGAYSSSTKGMSFPPSQL